jgi:hypothetical protein
MKAQVTNFGPTRSFPTCIGNVCIGSAETREIENAKAISELKNFPLLKVVCDGQGGSHGASVDWSKFKINHLRSVASRYKIRGVFGMKKADLVKALKEKHDNGQ